MTSSEKNNWSQQVEHMQVQNGTGQGVKHLY